MKDRETSFGTPSFAEMTFGGSLGGRVQRVLALLFGVVLAMVLFAVLANPARADTFTVTKTADTSDGTCDADCSLREAMGAANATAQADTITFASGVTGEILLSNGELRVESAGGPLSIEGPGADQLAVSGGRSSRVFLIDAGAEAEIAGLTVTGGDSSGDSFPSGGGIFNEGTVTVSNSTVSNNVAGQEGGGIFSLDGTVTVSNSTISNNVSNDGGGGIYNEGTVTVSNSTISDNVSNDGGGAGILNFGTVTVTSSTISDNTAGLDGGFMRNSGTATITNSTISGNTSGRNGGGIRSDTDIVSDTDQNPEVRTTIRNSTVSGNEASNRGGGLYNDRGLAVIENSTITQNVAPPGNGAGVASVSSSRIRTDVRASIISENSTTDVDFVDGTENSFNSLGSNIVGDGNATPAFDQLGDQTGVADPGLGPLQDNGGPTQTHAVLAGSPALDAVEPAGTTAAATQQPCGVQQDQRGVSRPQDGNGNGTAKCDIGSFELKATPPPAPVPPAPAPTSPAPAPPVSNPEPPKPPVTNPKPPSTNNPKPNSPNACTIRGNNRNNILRGTPRRDVICGFGGNDIIRGLGGNDVIRGGRGNDVIYGQGGNDKLYGGSGNDIIYGQAGRDRLYGQRGNDALFGGRGRDVLFGGPGKDFVNDGVKREVKRSVIDAKKAGEQAKKEARKLVNDVLRQVGIRR